MSEKEENKITSTEKSVKIKDPRRVELGKRLAKISKEAKARKAKERENASKIKREMLDYLNFNYLVGDVTLFATVVGLYYTWKKNKREIKEKKENKVTSLKKEEEEENYKRNKCLENL